MLAGEVIEVILQNLDCKLDLRGPLAMSDLQEKTLSQISCSDSSRFKLLDHLQHLQQFLLCSLNIGTERKVVNYTVKTSTKIAVIIKATYKKRGHRILMLSQLAIAQLLLKALSKTLFYRECVVLRAFVLRIVIRTQAIARNGIILLVFREGNLSWSFSLILLFLWKIFIQHWILLELLSDPLFKILDRKFDKFDGLDLQRRQLLSLLEF